MIVVPLSAPTYGWTKLTYYAPYLPAYNQSVVHTYYDGCPHQSYNQNPRWYPPFFITICFGTTSWECFRNTSLSSFLFYYSSCRTLTRNVYCTQVRRLSIHAGVFWTPLPPQVCVCRHMKTKRKDNGARTYYKWHTPLMPPPSCLHSGGPCIVNRTCGTHQHLYIFLFLLTMFGLVYYDPPYWTYTLPFRNRLLRMHAHLDRLRQILLAFNVVIWIQVKHVFELCFERPGRARNRAYIHIERMVSYIVSKV